MREFEEWLSTPNSSSSIHPVDRAAEAHYRLVTLHPFTDGNGRTARLLMNLILTDSGYPISVIPVEERLSYIKSLEKAQLGGSQEDFFLIVIEAVQRSLDIYIEAMKT